MASNKRRNLKIKTREELLARHYQNDPAALNYIKNHQLYRNDPQGLWSDLRIYAQRGFQLKDIVNDLKTP